MSSSVRVRDLVVRYGRQLALDEVSFDLDPGTATALVGANGSGKSTLLHVLAGLVPPSAGRVELPPGDIAYVLQYGGRGAWMPLTVDEVLRMGRYPGKRTWQRLGPADHQAITEAAGRLDVEALGRRQFGELSGGQRQRVLVAQALAQQAPLLLMDEPITGLDLPSQERILDVVDQEAARGHIVVLSTHHLDEAHHCHQVLLLANRLVAAGPPDDVLVPELLRDAYEVPMFGAHADHDHPSGPLLLDEHRHDQPD